MHANATLTPLMRAQMTLRHSQLRFSRRTTALLSASAKRPSAAGSLAPKRLPHAPGRPFFGPSSSAPQDQSPARSPDPRPAPPAPLLRSDPHGPPRLQGHPLPRPPPSRPPPPLFSRTSQTSASALRTRHPGELLHLDIKKLGRFIRPGVRATGDRTHRNPGAGVESPPRRHRRPLPPRLRLSLPDEKNPQRPRRPPPGRRLLQRPRHPHPTRPHRPRLHLPLQTLRRTPATNSASNIASPNPIALRPTARPNASSRPSPASGPTPVPMTPVTTALPSFLLPSRL